MCNSYLKYIFKYNSLTLKYILILNSVPSLTTIVSNDLLLKSPKKNL